MARLHGPYLHDAADGDIDGHPPWDAILVAQQVVTIYIIGTSLNSSTKAKRMAIFMGLRLLC